MSAAIACLLISPTEQALDVIEDSGGSVISVRDSEVYVDVPEEWVCPDDFSDEVFVAEYGTLFDFVRDFAVTESDVSKVSPRLFVPAPNGAGLPSLIWEHRSADRGPVTYSAGMRE